MGLGGSRAAALCSVRKLYSYCRGTEAQGVRTLGTGAPRTGPDATSLGTQVREWPPPPVGMDCGASRAAVRCAQASAAPAGGSLAVTAPFQAPPLVP